MNTKQIKHVRVYVDMGGKKGFMASFWDQTWSFADQAHRIEAYAKNMNKRYEGRVVIDDGACRMIY